MVCLKDLAKQLSAVNRVPEKFNLTKATEVALLAQHYLQITKKYESLLKSLTKVKIS
jgi:hypothetical protein